MNDTIHTVRLITDHAITPINDPLRITVQDAPGAGGASHHYEIKGMWFSKNDSASLFDTIADENRISILFQNGPIPEVGVNGVTNEALLAIVADRLRGFQSGPFACEENAAALDHIERALALLKGRTRDRIKRGVEGTYKA